MLSRTEHTHDNVKIVNIVLLDENGEELWIVFKWNGFTYKSEIQVKNVKSKVMGNFRISEKDMAGHKVKELTSCLVTGRSAVLSQTVHCADKSCTVSNE